MDYDKLAGKFGGSAQEVDYDALAGKFGAAPIEAPGAPIEPEQSIPSRLMSGVANYVNDLAQTGFGAVRGAAGIGATIAQPVQSLANGALGNNAQMRQNLDANIGQVADTNSGEYLAGKIGSEVAITAPIGGFIGSGVKKLGMNGLGNAIASGGMSVGSPAKSKIANFLTRTAGGAITGAASTAAISPSDAGTGAVIGGALPGVVQAAGKIGNALTPNIAPEVVRLADKAKSLGIDIPADRLVDSKPLNALASTLNYVPMSGRAATEQKFESQLNKALSKTFGQNSENVTMALRKASAELGHKFDNTLKSNVVKVDQQLMDDIAKTRQEAANELVGDSLKIIDKQIKNLMSKANNGAIDGQAAYNIKKTLDRIGNGKGNEAFHARELKRTLMTALDRSLGPQGAKDFAEVRKHYGTMLDLEGLAKNGAEGGISIARLANMKDIMNPDLQDLADISAQFLKAREGQHGAMQRAVVGTSAGYFGGPAALAAGVALGRGANMALNSNLAKKAALGQINGPKLTKEELKALTSITPIAATE
jgi:hypothetical protein